MPILEFLKENSTKGTPVEISDVEFTLPSKTDTAYWSWTKGLKNRKEPIIKFNNSISFNNCKFEGLPFARLIFCDTIYENNDSTPCGLSLKFDNCSFDNLTLEGNFKWLEFVNCNIQTQIYLGGYLREITLKDCKFSNVFSNNIEFAYCTIDHSGADFNPLTMRTLNFLHDENMSAYFRYCKFNPSKKGHIINMGNCSYQNLWIEHSEFFEPVEFNLVKVDNDFNFANNKIDNLIDFSHFDCPVNQSTIEWKDIAHKLYVDNSKKDTAYTACNDSDLLQDIEFNNLLTSYNFFTNLYSAQGNNESKNAVYIEKKELTTKRAKAIFHHTHSLYNFINMEFNSFLGWFCDYATNPVKALLNCFYVMFLFAAFYFIFPSLPDHLTKYKFIGYFDKAIEYFTHDKSLADIHKEVNHEHVMELNRFKVKLKETKGLVPRIITVCGQAFFNTHQLLFELLNKSLLKLDLCKKSWKKVSGRQKLILGFLAGIYFLGFVINGIIMRAINSVTLSLNSFVTLGAAGIETKGIARYVTVAEGSVGWFFLTIFAVTLITQLLQ
jgi:hypothetical protein